MQNKNKYGPWTVYLEAQRGKKVFVIRRKVLSDGKSRIERLPPIKYRQWKDNPEEMKKLCIRLNEQILREQRIRDVVEIKHAFISPKLLDEYKELLLQQSPDKNRAVTEFFYLQKYFLNFFINKLQISDPLHWHQIHKTKWAEYLLSKETPGSAFTKRSIVNAANRFMVFLHDQRPAEVVPLKFQPITKAMFKKVEAQRRLDNAVRKRSMISDEHWVLISKTLPENLKPFVLLSYCFGLRRTEAMGLKKEDVRKGYLSIERQLIRFSNQQPSYGPLKSRESRKVPYWFSTPDKTVRLIDAIPEKLMHPDTLSDLWSNFMDKLHLTYDFHDLRHTFITKAFRVAGVEPRDVQLAAGHKDIQTTMSYTHDDRSLDDEVFISDDIAS